MKKHILFSMLMAGAAWQPAVAAGIIDDVVTKGRMERNGGMTATLPSVSDSLAYEAYLDSISRKFDLGEVVVTGTRTPKFLKDTRQGISIGRWQARQYKDIDSQRQVRALAGSWRCEL